MDDEGLLAEHSQAQHQRLTKELTQAEEQVAASKLASPPIIKD
jgi:hypothetical protein